MAKTQTLDDLLEYARRLNGDAESAKAEDQNLAAVQDAMRNTSQASDWTFLRTRKRMTTREQYNAGAVNVTRYSTHVRATSNASAVTASFPASIESTAATFDIKLNGERVDYMISARRSATSLTLVDPYVGTASLAKAAFVIFRRSYDLPANFREMIAIVDVRDPDTPLERINHKEMLELSLRRSTGSTPENYSIENKTGDAVRQLWLYPFPNGDTRFQYDLIYQRWPTKPVNPTDVIDWPDDLMPLLKAAIAVELAMENQDSERYDLAKTEYSSKLEEALKGDVDESASYFIGSHSSMGGANARRRGFQHYDSEDQST